MKSKLAPVNLKLGHDGYRWGMDVPSRRMSVVIIGCVIVMIVLAVILTYLGPMPTSRTAPQGHSQKPVGQLVHMASATLTASKKLL